MSEGYGLSESDDGELKLEFDIDYREKLSDFPEVLEFINKLREHIKWQHKKINKLHHKLIEQKKQRLLSREKALVDNGTQTDALNNQEESLPSQDWTVNEPEKGVSIIDQVKEAAESALQQTGFVYDETSGLYYDYNTGYYYDATQGLYYDGNTGTYYYYDEQTKTYKYHSQTPAAQNKAPIQEKIKKKEKRKARKANKDDGRKRKVARPDVNSEGDEPEEGECSDSDNSHTTPDNTPELSSNNESEIEDEQEIAKTYPPCMRIIVKETGLPKLKVGSLFLVTYTGGSMGREGDHAVLVPDINISKHHAKFQYDEEKGLYQIIDLGSRNGTVLNGKRLSVAKQESEPHEIAHGSIVQVGTTKLLCHIHNGHETCGYCEPGLVQRSSNIEENKTLKKTQHISELRRLKHKFGVEKDNVATASQVACGYQDRAQARRDFVGSSTHHVKTQQSSLDTSIAKDNRGFKLLSKMGWSEGRSLGKDGDGRTEPLMWKNVAEEEIEYSEGRLVSANPGWPPSNH
ncbi:angiogenic factor with G patch and FHA domains 1 isoform X2 [Cephus cinctus]|uniref:Angiogenic factor with G patch and FHA domains 1 isoform X2 n=1 Tax=Cephus cinctus TaxID=211228 RepID=A0AAJ7FV45_CEPCN|nr:angiogenic factor with G patch and FHA domains 1 isoform X2 [Cephus cinctus]